MCRCKHQPPHYKVSLYIADNERWQDITFQPIPNRTTISTKKMDRARSSTHSSHGNTPDASDDMTSTYSPTTHEMALLRIGSNPEEVPQYQQASGRLFQVPMPQLSTGLVTFAYKRALLNRIEEPKLREGGRYDVAKFTPTFVHDTLMLPGSLANLIGKGSSEDVLKRMTPALLPGHHAHIQVDSNQPCLVSSLNPTDYVQGMVLFGQGKAARDFIHKHYRPHAKRKKVPVEIEVMVPIPPEERKHEHDFWRPQRRTIQVHAWKWSKKIEECVETCQSWTLEDYLGGTLASELPMRIEANAKGDEEPDGYLGRDVVEFDIEVEKREVIYGAPGRLHYERVQGSTWSGW